MFDLALLDLQTDRLLRKHFCCVFVDVVPLHVFLRTPSGQRSKLYAHQWGDLSYNYPAICFFGFNDRVD